jgi:pimeloyl-ACP methyl ester carboxylesterase
VTIECRTYGSLGPLVVVIHGGPGAIGYMAPLARGLAGSFRVLEPFQRGRGELPLTVAQHVADLIELLESRAPGERPALVGSSWGAMLALAFAAAHPGIAGPLVLIGCGTFDLDARARMRATLESRTDQELRRRLERLRTEIADPDERLRAMGELILPLYSWELITDDQELVRCDAAANSDSWADMIRLQQEGVFPAAFSAIDSPVLMLHGSHDPHPGAMIRASLEPYLPQLEYHEWPRCGHYPWLERAARDDFFERLKGWLERRFKAR